MPSRLAVRVQPAGYTKLFLIAGMVAIAEWRLMAAPALAQAPSRWNVLAYGGKGTREGAPICRALPFFSKSPLPLDFDNDFYREAPDKLRTQAEAKPVGRMAGRKIYQIRQTVSRGGTTAVPAIKIVVVERRPDEFCDVYQNQFAYDPTNETDETAIIDIDGRAVLKTYETDGRTWFLQYWLIDEKGPERLNVGGLYAAIDLAAPDGATPFRGALNFSNSHFRAETPDGVVELDLSIQGRAMVAIKKRWISRFGQ